MKKINLKSIVAILAALMLVGASTASARPGPHGHGRPPAPHGHYHHHHHGGGGDDLLAGACLGAFGALALFTICNSEQQSRPATVVEETTVTRTVVQQPVVTQTTTTYAW
jgi:hypothetical protein